MWSSPTTSSNSFLADKQKNPVKRGSFVLQSFSSGISQGQELSSLFLRLGFTAFGGPAAHIAMMRDEVVTKRGWFTDQEFLDLLGATNLIPGPNSTEMAIHIGYRRAGWRGLLIAGVCFIAPAMLIVLALAALYVRYSTLPQATALLLGINPVVIAIIIHALWSFGYQALKTVWLIALSGLVLLLYFLGANVLVLLFRRRSIDDISQIDSIRAEVEID